MLLWFHDHRSWFKGTIKQRMAFAFHALIALIGAFLSVGGTYSTVELIIDAYATNAIGTNLLGTVHWSVV